MGFSKERRYVNEKDSLKKHCCYKCKYFDIKISKIIFWLLKLEKSWIPGAGKRQCGSRPMTCDALKCAACRSKTLTLTGASSTCGKARGK